MRNNISPYYSFGNAANFTAEQQQSAVQKAQTDAKYAVDNSLVGRMAENSAKQQSPVTAVISILGAVALVLGVSKGVNYLIKSNKFFNISKPFDWIAQKAGANKAFQKVAGALETPVKGLKKWFNNLSIVKHLKDPVNRLGAKNKLAQSVSKGTGGEAIDTLTDTLKKLHQRDALMPDVIKAYRDKNYNDLFKNLQAVIKQGGADKADKKVINKILSGINDAGLTPEAEKLLRGRFIGEHGNKSLPKLLSNMTGLGKSSTEVKDMVKLVGEIVKEYIKKFDNFPKIFDDHILKNFSKSGSKVIDYQKMTNELGKVFERNTGGMFAGMNTNIADALKKYAILRGYGAETKAGALAQKIILRGAEGMSNGITAPSLMSLLMAVGIYKGVFDKVQEAPKGEKGSTFAEEAVTDMGMYMLIPASAALTYGAASLRNLGGNNPNLLQKLVRLPAKILGMGLGPDPAVKTLGTRIKGFAGGTLRFAAILMVLNPLLIKPFIKVCHKLFGKPTNSEYDKDKNKPVKQPQPQIQEQSSRDDYVRPELYASPTNLINRIKNPTLQQQPPQLSFSQSERRYIPSSVGVQLQPEDDRAANDAMTRAAAAEKLALEMLAMK